MGKIAERGSQGCVSLGGGSINQITEEITDLLSSTFKAAVDEESLTVFQTCAELSKDI